MDSIHDLLSSRRLDTIVIIVEKTRFLRSMPLELPFVVAAHASNYCLHSRSDPLYLEGK